MVPLYSYVRLQRPQRDSSFSQVASRVLGATIRTRLRAVLYLSELTANADKVWHDLLQTLLGLLKVPAVHGTWMLRMIVASKNCSSNASKGAAQQRFS